MSVRIRWKSGVAASSYQVWRNTVNDSGTATLIADDVTGSMYVDTTATPGVTYYYWLKAKNSLGTSAFGSVISGMGVLKAPTGVIATLLTPSAIEITWNASSGASTYQVQRSTTEDFASWTEVTTTSALSYSDNPPLYDTPYYYRVVAKTSGSSGHSSPSQPTLGFKTIAAPDIPTGVAATDDEVDQVTISWSAASRAQVYDVYRNTSDTTSGATLVGTTDEIEYVDNPGAGDFWYFVKARNYTGSSGFSSSAAGNEFDGLPAPTGVNATDDEIGFIDVSWDAVPGAYYYNIYRNSTNSTVGMTYVGSVVAPYLTVRYSTSTILDPDTTYWFFVAAEDYYHAEGAISSGDSGYGFAEDGAPPSAPTGFNATDTLLDKITCSWSPVGGASSYDLYRNGSLLVSGITGTSYDDSGAAIDVTYTYYVVAVNSFGSSSGSATNTGRRPPPPYSYTQTGTADYTDTWTMPYAYTLTASFNADTTIRDRLQLYKNGTLVFDTGCNVGSSSATFAVVAGDVLQYDVNADCLSTGLFTNWSLYITS